jgi:hypothetical protein
MQMLLFATGILVVALLFLNFVSGMELRNITSSTLELNAQMISGQLTTDSTCSVQIASIPEFFNYGLANNRLYYELIFSKVKFEDYQKLVLSINEYKKTGVIDARGVNVHGEVFLLDPDFMTDGAITSQMFNKDRISLYPRQSIKGQTIAPPNAFVALKEIVDGKTNLYIIPCSTHSGSFTDAEGRIYSANNCEENILRLGCFLLKEKAGVRNLTDRINQCFSIAGEISRTGDSFSQTRYFTWADCQSQGYHN